MKKELEFCFKATVPVMLGYLVLGMAFGLVLKEAGYGFWWALASSVSVYAGSMQFVLTSMLGSGMTLLSAALMTLSVNSRHIFYGLSFIEKFKEMKKARPYLIFSLTDETYSVFCSLKVPDGMNEDRVWFMIALLDHIYWVAGSVLGSLAGELVWFSTEGVDFAMTALFIVILVDKLRDRESRLPALAGAAIGILCLVIFGTDGFILPSLIAVSVTLLLMKNMRRGGGEA